MHDSMMMDAGCMYNQLERVYEEYGVVCLVDSAFCVRDRPFLIKSAQSLAMDATLHDILVHHKVTLVRQLAEWGMGTFQCAFPRMKDRMKIAERGERRYFLEIATRLNNMRADLVGINQICTTYMLQFFTTGSQGVR